MHPKSHSRLAPILAACFAAAVLWVATTEGLGTWTRSQVVPLVLALTDASSQQAHDVHNLVRKLLHVPAYALLTLSVTWAIAGWRNRAAWSAGLVLVVAIADESIQAVTGGRDGSVADVALDLCGATVGILAASWVLPDRRSEGAR